MEIAKEEENQEKDKFEEIISRYKIDIKKLELEQEKLSKNIILKDKINFELAERIAGIENIFIRNNIISAIVVLSNEEMAEQEYFSDKLKFPYLPGFRAYRELPAMISAFTKLDEKPDIILIRGNGILHPRALGLASHFSLATGIPTIGIADSLMEGAQVKENNIYINGKLSGKVIQTKEGANPLYISPGNMISVESAEKLVRKLTKEPHKIPEPLRLAKRYAKEISKELFKTE